LLPSAPMMDPSIPMSFVMSAGLVQVENSIAKSTIREGNQYVLVQNCFRHFDLDKVGTDDIHLSFFEMPGAFVFGPNKKVDTIQKMWRLATSVFGIEKEKIWPTYFAGGSVSHNWLTGDGDTKDAWLATDLNPNQLVGLGVENNYWVQGAGIDGLEIRKCGPNTELFFDRGSDIGCNQECNPGCACGRFIEFSNSLFISSEIDPEYNSITPLANPFTETVIGIERIAMILRNYESVFGIEEYRPILRTIDSHIFINDTEEKIINQSKYIIADHFRALYNLITNDAPPPGKDGRARIMRTLIRRIITRMLVLGIPPQDFLHTVARNWQRIIPLHLRYEWAGNRFEEYFHSELHRYLQTIERGRRQIIRYLEASEDNIISSDQKLHLKKNLGLLPLLTSMLIHQSRPKPKYATVFRSTGLGAIKVSSE